MKRNTKIKGCWVYPTKGRLKNKACLIIDDPKGGYCTISNSNRGKDEKIHLRYLVLKETYFKKKYLGSFV